MRRLLARLPARLMQPATGLPEAVGPADLRPDAPFMAIGDIHGCFDLLQMIESTIADHAQDVPLVYVGDYIDRGEASAQVLSHLMRREAASDRITCLMGNHEQMCLRFLKDPLVHGPMWLRNGGLQMLASYGIGQRGGSKAETASERLESLRDRLAQAMGPEMIGWLARRPLIWTSGNVAVVHAGADPQCALEKQTSHALLWGHPEFGQRPRQDGIWVVHGHTIVATPQCARGCISIDSGAYATGHLSAALISQGGVRFFTT